MLQPTTLPGPAPAEATIRPLLKLTPRGLLAPLAALALAEGERWYLWTPVALGVGILAGFALERPPEPALAVAAAGVAVVCCALAAWLRTVRQLAAAALLGVALAAAGLAIVGIRTSMVDTRFLWRAGTYRIEGRITELAPTERGARLLLASVTTERPVPGGMPQQVRVTVRSAEGLAVGDRTRLLARLQPPSPPLVPGGFDFARTAWFQGVGAVGFALGRAERLAPDEAGSDLSAWAPALRETIAARIVARRSDAAGQMSAALMTGLQAGISRDVWQDMQRSGLAHLISISGLHMTLVAGVGFVVLRYGLALLPWLALRVPIKKIAAVGGMACASFYLLISGASVPTQRSWIMVMIGFVAILADRNPVSLRVIATAALAVLILRPESLLGPSFQLSFAAVLALIAAYEAGAARLSMARGTGRRLPVPLTYVLGVVVTTLIASTATAPLTAWHFQSFATWSVLANMIAVPLTSFVAMPSGLLAIALMPVGLEAPALAVMTWSVQLVLDVAAWVARLPGAAVAVPQLGTGVLLLFTGGGLWLCLWRRPWRFLGLAPMAAALVLAVLTRPIDVLVEPTFAMVAARGHDGGLRLLVRDRDGFMIDGWERVMGVDVTTPFPNPWAGPADGIACDAAGCIVERAGRKLALATAIEAVIEDCALVDLVVAAVGPERCDGRARLIGPRALRASDGLAIRLHGDGVIVETVAERRGRWPWAYAGRRTGED